MKGKAVRLGNNISTDQIIPGRFAHLRSNLPELAKHVFEDLSPTFRSQVSPGDFLVAGKNFGQGSSREHAPLVIKMAGISAILAQSAARIFFRNAYNIGLPVLICDTTQIEDGDLLEIDLARGSIHNLSRNSHLSSGQVPRVMLRILEEGGIIPYIKRYGGFEIK